MTSEPFETVRWVIVPAAGVGRRMGCDVPKQYLPLAGRCVLSTTLARLHEAWPQAQQLVCLSPQDAYFDTGMLPDGIDWLRIDGGAERADSVWAGLVALEGYANPQDWVAVHDVARPCVRSQELRAMAAALRGDPVGGLLAVPASDTMKRACAGQNQVAHTESRVDLWHALTPQLFRYGVLRQAMYDAYQRAEAQGRSIAETITDEASAVEALGLSPRLVAGRRDNLKITHPEDLALAEQIIAAQQDALA
ncbi:2-C-methyl-D-erythritol 4-phosphate cytidylyltransferase [Zymobacter sp. IVIA_12111.31 C1]|uniref:2-C-methyl-D-erythritol 4-phosphate cytidylyltransferase n=1 Tax=Zymobacter sp. IVIA_12111.31 C1 TaxID=3394854 RepID=UPI0039C21C98